MPVYTNFKGVDGYDRPTLSEQLTDNLMYYTGWSFLDIGAYSDVTIPTSGIYGGDFHKLKPVRNPFYSNGQVWQGIHNNWVYESGLENYTPIQISGIFVDDTFYPVDTTGDYSYYINYPNGQVYFDSPISENSEVKLEYSFKEVHIYDTESVPFFQRFDYQSYRPDNEQFSQVGSGDYDMFREMIISLPCLAIDIVTSESIPHALGGSSQRAQVKIGFHSFAQNKRIANRIAEIINIQKEKSIYLFDTYQMIQDGAFPLDYRGTIHSGTLPYTALTKNSEDGGYRWRKLRINDSKVTHANKIHQNLWHAVTNINAEIIVSNI